MIPGRGRISDEHDVAMYRDMVTIIRDRIKALIAKKKSLAEVIAARPTLDYDGRYGAETGPWTTSDVHRSRVSGSEQAMKSALHAPRVLWPCSCRTGVAAQRGGGPPPAPRPARAGRPVRSGRHLGVDRDGRLAVADGHGAERRCRERAGQRRGAPGRDAVGCGSGQRPQATSARPSASAGSCGSPAVCASRGRTTTP